MYATIYTVSVCVWLYVSVYTHNVTEWILNDDVSDVLGWFDIYKLIGGAEDQKKGKSKQTSSTAACKWRTKTE